MRNPIPFLLTAAALVLATGCDDTPQSSITVEGGNEMTLAATQTSAEVRFTSPALWTATLMPETDWLTISAASGSAGDASITLQAQANTAADARTTTLVLLPSGGETTQVLITQLGTAGTDSTDTPVFVPETAIRQVTILDPDDGTESNYAFEYDEQGRVVRMQGSDNYDGTSIYLYIATYEGNTVTVDGDDGVHIVATLDEQGRAARVAYTESLSPDGGGSSSPTRTDITLTYDAAGRLVNETGKSEYGYGYDEYSYDYTWTGGDLTRVHCNYYDEDFAYSTHPNTGNIDLNWLITAGYGSGSIAPLGIFNLLGTRSTHYAVPCYWAENDVTPQQMSPVCEDDLDKPVTEEGMYYEDGETTTEYTFDGPEGSLSTIATATPVYAVHYRMTGTIIDYDPDAYEMRDGKKYYYVIVDWGEREITSREEVRVDRQEVTVGY